MPEIPMGPVGEIVRVNVRRLRESKRISQGDLSRLMGEAGWPMLASGVGRIEQGLRRVDVDDLVVLARILGVRPEELLAPVEPEICANCDNDPPTGFTCQACGTPGKPVKTA